MSLDDSIREKVVFVGGKVGGVQCPECGCKRRDVSIEPHTFTDVTCPECGATILSEDQKSELRQAQKL